MRRCPKCWTQFFTKTFTCSCGAVFKNNMWTNVFDLKTVIAMDNFSFQNIYLHYIKNLPDAIQDEIGKGINAKRYVGYKKIKTLHNQVVLIFRYTVKDEARYIAWNLNNNMIYRCKVDNKETVALIGERQINDLDEWVRSLVGEEA